jgi:hypothetical protein
MAAAAPLCCGLRCSPGAASAEARPARRAARPRAAVSCQAAALRARSAAPPLTLHGRRGSRPRGAPCACSADGKAATSDEGAGFNGPCSMLGASRAANGILHAFVHTSSALNPSARGAPTAGRALRLTHATKSPPPQRAPKMPLRRRTQAQRPAPPPLLTSPLRRGMSPRRPTRPMPLRLPLLRPLRPRGRRWCSTRSRGCRWVRLLA